MRKLQKKVARLAKTGRVREAKAARDALVVIKNSESHAANPDAWDALKRLKELDDVELVLDSYLTVDPDTIRMKEKVKILAKHSDTVLIHGPSGTGKEIIAQALHAGREGAYVDLNCGGLTAELLNSELYGHVKGAFTGAHEDKAGLFKSAINGTIFLDEIGEMPLELQSSLLRTLEQRHIRPVGDTKNISIEKVRVVLATNRDLNELVAEGRFRKDLLYRINTFEIVTKSLDRRPDDIHTICKTLSPKFPVDELLHVKRLQAGEGEPLFDGNVRELLHHIRRWEVLGEL